jgi:dTDP-L-rhamnose 4-epimerase
VSDISKLKSIGWKPQHSPEDSVREYRKYLESITGIDDILDNAERKMKSLGVVRETGN